MLDGDECPVLCRKGLRGCRQASVRDVQTCNPCDCGYTYAQCVSPHTHPLHVLFCFSKPCCEDALTLPDCQLQFGTAHYFQSSAKACQGENIAGSMYASCTHVLYQHSPRSKPPSLSMKLSRLCPPLPI